MQEWDVLDEVSLLEDSAGPAGAAATLSHEHVAICWRGDCKYFATLLQQQSQQQPQQTGGQVQQQAASAALAATGQPGMAITSLKIWLRSGCKLHAIGEGADGLLPVGFLQHSSCLIGLRVIMVFQLGKCL
jgi:IKI3 family